MTIDEIELYDVEAAFKTLLQIRSGLIYYDIL